MTKYSRASCSATTCLSQKIVGKATPAFFRFPLNEERCRLWCIRSGRKDLLEKPVSELHKKHYLCANHFSQNQFQGSSGSRSRRLRLITSAIPSSLDCQSNKELSKECRNGVSTDSLDNQNLNHSNDYDELCFADKNRGCASDWSVEAKNVVPVGGTSSSVELDPPYLKVFIQHNVEQSEPGGVRVSYQYHDIDGSVTDFESLNFRDKYNLEVVKDFVYQERGKTIIVKGSTINKFRQDHTYFGPLKAIPDSSLLLEESNNEIHCTQLSMVDIGVTQKDDRSVNEHELNTLLYDTPGIIPSCSPFSLGLLSEEDYTVFSKGRKNFRVWNGAVAYFKQKTGVENALALKAVEEEVTGLEGRFCFGPVTVLYIAPKKTTSDASRPLSARAKRLQKRRKSLKLQKNKRDRNLTHTYGGTYVNWAQRGNVCFSELKRVGIRFIDELLGSTVSDSLQDFTSSLSTSAQHSPNRLSNPNSFVEDPSFPLGSQDSAEERWSFLCNLAKNDSTLIEFQYNMDQEKWIEIKRNFNVFQIDGESCSDILLKVVLRNLGKQSSLAYYLRCLGTLVKSGLLTSKDDTLQILKSFREDRYICIGFDKDRFLYQSDENHLLRKHLKEHGHLRITPFESLHSKKCKAIVRDSPDIGNCKFKRGPVMIQGPIAICQACEKLYDKLEELRDPTLEICLNKEDIFKPKQRFGPINLNVTKNIRKLCTETPFEFISDARREGKSARKVDEGLDKLSKQSKSFDLDAHISEDEKPSIKISEEEFLGMLSIEMNGKGSKKLEKGCNKCNFQAKSMLSLFSHMSTHMETVVEECNSCNVKFSSVAALTEHKEQNHSEEVSVCSICQETSLTTLDFSFHMSSHRSSKPFVCAYCDQRFQTIEIYKKHMKSVHNLGTLKEMNFMCTVCQTYFYTHDRLFIHALNNDHVEKSISCSICKFSCNLVSDFQTHILNHSYNQREYHNLAFCSDCKKFFFSSYELEDHVKDIHKTYAVKGRVSSMLDNEKASTAKNPKIFCNKCFKAYGTQGALQKHLEVSHSVKEVIEEQPASTPDMSCGIACNICGMKFLSSYFLNNHLNFHTANRPTFQCDDDSYLCLKRGQADDNVVQNNPAKHVEKQLTLQQHQQQLQHQHQRQQEHHPHHQQPHHHHHQHISSYNLFVSQQQPFPDGQIPTIAEQSQIVQAPDEATWNQPPNSVTVDEAQNSVYSLLHL